MPPIIFRRGVGGGESEPFDHFQWHVFVLPGMILFLALQILKQKKIESKGNLILRLPHLKLDSVSQLGPALESLVDKSFLRLISWRTGWRHSSQPHFQSLEVVMFFSPFPMWFPCCCEPYNNHETRY